VGFARGRTLGAEPDTAKQGPDREAEFDERILEQAVLLETIAAAARGHELGEYRIAIDADAAPEDDIEILERDGETMRPLDLGQALGGGGRRLLEADAVEISEKIESHPAADVASPRLVQHYCRPGRRLALAAVAKCGSDNHSGWR